MQAIQCTTYKFVPTPVVEARRQIINQSFASGDVAEPRAAAFRALVSVALKQSFPSFFFILLTFLETTIVVLFIDIIFAFPASTSLSMNDPRRLTPLDPAWQAYQYQEMGAEEFVASQPSTSNSRRGVKRRKDSGQVEADSARRAQAMTAGLAPGHVGSDGFGHGMMIGPGAGVNPEDIHPQVSRHTESSLRKSLRLTLDRVVFAARFYCVGSRDSVRLPRAEQRDPKVRLWKHPLCMGRQCESNRS
jgi:hypothetical protein